MKTRLHSYCFTTLEDKEAEMSVRANEPIVENYSEGREMHVLKINCEQMVEKENGNTAVSPSNYHQEEEDHNCQIIGLISFPLLTLFPC